MKATARAAAVVLMACVLPAVAPPQTHAIEPAASTVSLPAIPPGMTVRGLRLDGAGVYLGLAADQSGPMTIYRAAADGSGSWESVVDPWTDAPLVAPSAAMPFVDSGVLLSRQPSTDQEPCSYRLITGPETAETLTGCASRSLVHGGSSILTTDTTTSPHQWSLRSLDGTELDSGSGSAPAVADGVVAQVPDADHFEARPVGSPDPVTPQSSPSPCGFEGPVRTRAHVALVGCKSGNTALLRTDAAVPPFPLTGSGWQIGAGFLVNDPSTYTAGSDDLTVVDLGAGHSSRKIPVQAKRVAVDRGNSPAFAVLTANEDVQVVTVTGLTAPGITPDDTLAPVTTVHGPGPVTADVTPQFTWTGGDPTHPGAARFERRTRVWRHGTVAPAWSSPAAVSSSPVELPAGAGTDVCLQVRGIDWAGNVGAWQGDCTFIDGTAPKVNWVSTQMDNILKAPSSSPVRVTWGGSDNYGVAGYDLQYRSALSGRPMGGWVAPTEWQSIGTRAARVFPAGSTTCFRVTVRDRAGHTSTSSRSTCWTVPLDDRALTPSSVARRGRSASAFEGTITTLRAGDSLLRRGMRARVVVLRIDGHPRSGCPRVYLAGERATSCSTSADSMATYYRYPYTRNLQGSLRITVPRANRGSYRVDSVYASHS